LVNKLFFAVSPTPKPVEVEVTNPGDIPPSASNWGIVAAIVVAAMPHLWQWLGGHQKARNTLTETLLQNLTDSYQLASTSNEQFRTMIERVAARPTEVAEENAEALRDLLGDMADLRGQVQVLTQKVDKLATMITREAQKP
jgi:hypothetical protein